MIYLVRFPKMNWEDFELGPGQTNMLTTKQKKEITKIISTNCLDTWQSPETNCTYHPRDANTFECGVSYSKYVSNFAVPYETLILASSLDIVLTKLEFVPESVNVGLNLKITVADLRNEILWEKECSVGPVKLIGSPASKKCVPDDKRCLVVVDDVYLQAHTTYKLITTVQAGLLYLTNRVVVDNLKINDQIFRIVAKSFHARNVGREEVEEDEEWTQMLRKLSSKPCDPKETIIGPASVIFSMSFIE